MENKEVIATLKNAAKVLGKTVKSNCLPADLEAEACNLRYEILALLSKLEEENALSKEMWLCT